MRMKDIEGYEGLYAITDDGQVWSHRRQIFLKQRSDKFGYLRVSLHKNKELKTFFIHRLVALAFIPNPEGKAVVNHLDECKTNNNVSNLEWATVKENNRYGTRIERAAEGRKQPVRCVETGEVYESVKAAGAAMNTYPFHISACLTGKQKTCKGYHWERYEEKTDLDI